MFIFYVRAIFLIASLLVVTFYKKTKINLTKLVYAEDITGTWERGGGFISEYKGVTMPLRLITPYHFMKTVLID